MNDQWTNRLSEYLDGELDNKERTALEAHLATCGSCRGTLAELREVVARAQSLHDQPPANDLWPELARRIREGSVVDLPARSAQRARRFSFSIPQLLAACLAVVVVSGGSVWLALNGRQPEQVVTPQVTSPPVVPVTAATSRWRVQTDMAIAELQETLTLNESRLDTATVRVVRENLAIIDRAIAQAQKALRRDPGNTYLNLHLANTMRQKIELLRRANALASSES
jgi:predicted anti-sigma-YlaC factor YlaD